MLKIRKQDPHGSGEWHAPRINRKHQGIDIISKKGETIRALSSGEVTRIGFPYPPRDPKKGHLRYVEIKGDDRARCRYFYVSSLVKRGQHVKKGDVIGISQPLDDIWHGMTQHYHLEVIGYINPMEYFDDAEFE